MAYEHGSSTHRLPPWLRRPIATPGRSGKVEDVLGELELHTVCRSAKCPNRGECFSSGTATFLIMGDACTRGCRFCAVDTRTPEPLDPEEPARLAEAARRMELSHIVVTTVTRDDLPDGGAAHFVAVIEAVRAVVPDATIEVLTSDFAGRWESVDRVVDAAPDVFNHNLETVPRLYGEVRPGADYRRSLDVLVHARKRAIATRIDMPTKSGLMLGLGESLDEIHEVMGDLREAGCAILTLGQYLRPSPAHVTVADFVEPDIFAQLGRDGRRMGFASVASAPFVRSSYHAGEMAKERAGAGSSQSAAGSAIM
ncbi:MAG: lipoyl synthase [Actinomycetota bacterium]|nr:lipoyl synthase [Actinomycetota bacterium]